MNKNINRTLMALVPVLRMNGEKVKSIEAVNDWYKSGGREYYKEVAEIAYENGHTRYADIGGDSNLTAVYDVIAVIQEIKPESKAIERIERGVYEVPLIMKHDLSSDHWCPVCGRLVTDNYCPSCGQKYDWSKKQDKK